MPVFSGALFFDISVPMGLLVTVGTVGFEKRLTIPAEWSETKSEAQYWFSLHLQDLKHEALSF
jgi:hypothetical protein